MSELLEIFNKYKTDKGYHHNYHIFYEDIFKEYKNNTDIKILEIGICDGKSLLSWRDYFPHGLIYGIDIVKNIDLKDKNIFCYYGDSTNKEFINGCFNENMFDIIIDDGSHACHHQLETLANIFPFLKSNGTYIIEDCDWSFEPRISSHNKFWNNWNEILKNETTYDVLNKFKKSGIFKSKFISDLDNLYLQKKIKNINWWWKEKNTNIELVKSRSSIFYLNKV